ncbi:cell division protein DivIC [Granulicatella balaenopterae]|uniref:Cell division protein DivIC n=1 Tax=Granulicatella balaenopterae TaxID=137733 RepID=A0A1H9JD02_9LACT|nr:septum formation initiator family protein [Granulicatella balaenopterae]SEQ84475.1 cell division protein DivIC [Granulicatella balaenopterae]
MNNSHKDMMSQNKADKSFKNQQKNAKVVLQKSSFIKVIGGIIVASLSITMVYQTIGQIQKASELDEQIVIATKKEADAKERKEMLQAQVELLNNDEYVAKLARSEYYLSKPGEIIFSLPKELDVQQMNNNH